MKQELLDILACPDCLSPLQISIFKESTEHPKEILEGVLLCKNCSSIVPIIESIPRFVPNILDSYPDFSKRYPQLAASLKKNHWKEREFRKIHAETQERFGFEWLNYPGSLAEDREIFLNETQLPPEAWKDKKVLDAGCGMGRYSRIAHELGATVISLDLSPALIRLKDLAFSSPRLHLIQGNLMQPPFREKSFDIIYSIGVLHHTPSAKEAFKKLARAVRDRGFLSVWLYGTAGRFKDFRTNPLRADRQGLKKYIFFVWLIVMLREALSEALRLLTVRIPHKVLFLLCYPLALLGKVPFIKYLTFSVHPQWRVRLQENFDWLSPPYQSHHTKEELISWFEENGFEVLKILPHGFVPKPGILGRKK